MINVRHLKYFKAVANELHFRRAADKINVSQPALSLQIKQLEEILGVELLKRSRKEVSLTNAGIYFASEADEILERIQKTCEKTRLISKCKSGTIKLGFLSSAATGILQQAVKSFSLSHPEISLLVEQMTNKDMVDALIDHKLDLGICRLPLSFPESLKFTNLYEDNYFLAYSNKHPIAKNKNVSLADFKDDTFITFPRKISPEMHDGIISLLKENSINPNVSLEANEQLTILGMVASDLGVAIVPGAMKSIKLKGIKYLPVKSPHNKTSFILLSRNDNNPLINELCSNKIKIAL